VVELACTIDRHPSSSPECGEVIHFIYYYIHLNIPGDALDLLMICILVSIICIVAVSVTGVMTYLKRGELIRGLRMAHRLEDEKKDGR